MDHLGRKPLFVGAMIFGGTFCMVSPFTPEGTFRTVFALIGKFGKNDIVNVKYFDDATWFAGSGWTKDKKVVELGSDVVESVTPMRK